MKYLKVSQYVIFLAYKDDILLVNGYNGCMDIVTHECADLLKKSNNLSENIEKSTLNMLIKRGYVTEMSIAEEKEVFTEYIEKIDKINCEINKYNGSIMFLLSYDCNLSCSYCYQKHIRDENAGLCMTPDTIDLILTNSWEKLFNQELKKENVSFNLYGGEPFLIHNIPAIKKILFYAQKAGVQVTSISNATFIHQMPDFFGPNPGQINFVQVSFDGNEEYHNNSRINKAGMPSFRQILDNVHLLLEKQVRINLRINASIETLNGLDKLITILTEEDVFDHPLVYTYIHPLHNHFKQTDDSLFLTPAEISVKIKEKFSKLRTPIERKMEGLQRILFANEWRGPRKTRFCMQNMSNNYLIDPFLDVYNCYEEAGRKDRIIAKIEQDGNVVFNSRKNICENRSIVKMEKCLICPYALFCGGECGTLAIEQNGDIFLPAECEETKKVLNYALLNLVDAKISQNNLQDEPLGLHFPNL